MKVAILTDSNSGITQDEANKLGVFVLPMPFTIDGQEYKEDINLSQEEFYDKLMNNAEVFTSQPAVGEVTQLFDNILKDYDQIVHIPMSSGLSGSCQTALMLAEEDEYKGKVYVVDSQRISVTQKYDVLDALELSKQGKNAKEIHDILMENKLNATIYITVNTLEYLKKGGRITAAAAALGGLLKIKPIIMVAYTYDRDQALELKKQVEEAFPNHEVICDPLSLSVACHIGPHSLAVAACKKII